MRALRHRTRRGGRAAGHTLVEMVLTFTLFTGLLGVFSASLDAPLEEEQELTDRTEARRRADRAVEELGRVLTRTLWEGGFPQVVDGADVAARYPDVVAALGKGFAPAVDADVLLFLQPDDADGDGWPDLDADGAVVLRPEPAVLGLVPGGAGGYELVHVDADRNVRRPVGGLSGLRVVDSAASGFTQPLDALRATVTAPRARRGAADVSADLMLRLGSGQP